MFVGESTKIAALVLFVILLLAVGVFIVNRVKKTSTDVVDKAGKASQGIFSKVDSAVSEN